MLTDVSVFSKFGINIMVDLKTEIECISLRLEILIDESRRLYKLMENFQEMKNTPAYKIRYEIMNRLEKRKKEIKSELEELSERVKVVIAKQ